MKRYCLSIVAIGLASCSLAARSQQFPEGSSVPTAAQVQNYLDGKVFSVKLSDGNVWRLDYKSNGFFFVNTSSGFNGSGQWQAEDGKLCAQLKGRDRSCNDVRLHQDLMHLKRDNGEIIQYTVK